MGRKSSSKQSSKKSGKENTKFSQQKRRQLAFLVDKLLKLTSTFQATPNLARSWDHHLQVDCILKEIKNIEAPVTNKGKIPRQAGIDNYLKWLNDNGAKFEGVEISDFESYELGLKATKQFAEGSLILTVPSEVMMTEMNAKESELAEFIAVDPLLQNMPNITLALFLLLEKSNPDSFWKPYIDILPNKYCTIFYFTPEELTELKPSPVFETSLKLYRSIARQYAYFYNKIHTLEIPVLKNFQDIFTYDSYRWAVSTVMTRQNNIQMSNTDITAFIPLWDMCNHEDGKITTDYNKDLNRGECYALRDFQPGEQIFIFYGARPNADLFLHNGFVYPNNKHDSLSLALGISSSDPHRETRMALLNKLGLGHVTHYSLYLDGHLFSPELLAFIRIFTMNQDELARWSGQGLPGDLVSWDPGSSKLVGGAVERRAYTYLLTRCGLVLALYKNEAGETGADSPHRRNIKLLKDCEVQILNRAIKYLEDVLHNLPTEEDTQQ